MKKFLALFALLTVALACNLMNRKASNTNSSSSSGTSTSTDGEPVEKPNPTAAQQAAIANGQPVTWDQQGITWTLPPNWKKMSATTDMAQFGSGTEAFLIGNISAMGSDFPTDISLNAFYSGAQTRKKNGEVDELKWLELDGVKGVQFRESKPEEKNGIRRLQWMTYRKYGGQTQLVNIILSGSGSNFDKHADELYGILYSMKIVH